MKFRINAATVRTESLRPRGVVVAAPGGDRIDVSAQVQPGGALVFDIPANHALYVYQPSPIATGSRLKLESAPSGKEFPLFL